MGIITVIGYQWSREGITKSNGTFEHLFLLQDERRLLRQNEAFEQIRKNSARGRAMDDK